MTGKLGTVDGPYFGEFGGRYMPEALIAALDELEAEYDKAMIDPEFTRELDTLLRDYAGRPSLLTEVPRFAEHCGGARVLLRAVLPAAAAPLIVEVTLRLAYGILAEASLSFLGLGTQPPAASWGLMVAEGRRFLSLSPWATVAPGLAIMVVVLGFNLFGDALRDALDPRTRGRG